MPLSISQGDVWEVYHDIASYLLQTTSENVMGNKKGRSPRKMMGPSSAKGGVHRTSSQPLLSSSQPQPRVALSRGTRALSAGAVTRRLRTRVSHMHRGVPHVSRLKEPGKNVITYVMLVIYMYMWSNKICKETFEDEDPLPHTYRVLHAQCHM